MSLINVTNLTFSYEGSYDTIFEEVSFQIDTNWKLGFTGRNGRGKTTFFNLLLGKYEYKGTISADVTFEYFPYEVENMDDVTIDIVRQISPQAMDWEIERELSLLDMDYDALYRPFGTLSNGEQTKVLLAAMFLKENAFLLIDEPTNHLDIDARKMLSAYLNKKKGYILISHDRLFLDDCIDHILSINKTNIEIQKGNFSSWWANKEMQDNFERAENEKLKKDIKRLTKAARRTSDWSDQVEKSKVGAADKGHIGHMAAKMMQKSKNLERRQKKSIEKKSQLLKNIEAKEELKIVSLKFHDKRVLELSDIAIHYGDKLVCEGINFTIEQGEKVALQGKNGSGKSSILKLILGQDVPYEGLLKKNPQLVISYVSQDTSQLQGNLIDFSKQHDLDQIIFRAMLNKLDFSKDQFEKNIEDLSQGQKKKVLIAKSLSERAHLYIWDEPLNFIDVISRMQIENLLKEQDITLLFVEHDRAFCESNASKVVKL
ncbi:ribosomal protection-like ABC-F family protein [Granulicatella seriolae]|uniref:ABC-F type ribosomal protection protein n=1 Tax=Granulicatella seriolae TaxID=2967226 RepID=A0ABT1WQQ7_9LACT|nr:ABC-F type ribosomal protection protein [Granulicatella seriolae]